MQGAASGGTGAAGAPATGTNSSTATGADASGPGGTSTGATAANDSGSAGSGADGSADSSADGSASGSTPLYPAPSEDPVTYTDPRTGEVVIRRWVWDSSAQEWRLRRVQPQEDSSGANIGAIVGGTLAGAGLCHRAVVVGEA